MKSNRALWDRLSAIEFDLSESSFPFSARLARDNGWSTSYAVAVIEEYKRFAYLAMTAGHEVTPSDEVDQAWHLHLTYTRHYWGEFTVALGGQLHHGPTKGGFSENNRYRDNYERTLEAYEREFGDTPPAVIWPTPQERFRRAPFMQRVDTSEAVIVSKAALRRAAAFIFGGGVLLTGISTVSAAEPLSFISDSIGGWFDGPLKIAIVLLLGLLIIGVGLASTVGKGSAKSNKGHSGCGAGATGGGDPSGDGNSGDGGSGCGGCGGCGGG